ncbi:hypothetical protein E2C01_059852 [Portunus trituberculatus]|uniref:Uncharacterized protein n=1 Tax=Portunus trituberculatus TaxID=210409 RepID=A0A5B7H6Z1_PORTR|nr:hypothetical protein [Portunus trituberculatus]
MFWYQHGSAQRRNIAARRNYPPFRLAPCDHYQLQEVPASRFPR